MALKLKGQINQIVNETVLQSMQTDASPYQDSASFSGFPYSNSQDMYGNTYTQL